MISAPKLLFSSYKWTAEAARSFSILLLNKNLSGNEVIDHHHRCSENLHQHIRTFHVLIQDAGSRPHDQGVDSQADDAQDQKNDELLRLVGLLIRIKDDRYAQNIVDNHRNAEGDSAGNGGIDADKLRQGNHDAVIYEKAKEANQPEFDNLFK